MIIRFCLALLFLAPVISRATSVHYSDELVFDQCNIPEKVPVIYCQKDDYTVILQLDSARRMIGFVLGDNKKGAFSVTAIQENGTTNYYNSLSEKVNKDVVVPEYDTVATRLQDLEIHYERLSNNIELARKNAESIVGDLTEIQEKMVQSGRGLKSALNNTDPAQDFRTRF
ncbi:hypothetical protein [Alcanivorax sp. DP30]|uniref:hypothetical protein n=1 Tax=Alcanivorax sp. DP30 TaxID=2606217 RepID=UPI0013706E5C|nr:hypothetical protein [Alcanivorax sp. DP30]MZR64142.1 hypothetical protein [Alcanivorax sp. DP30]